MATPETTPDPEPPNEPPGRHRDPLGLFASSLLAGLDAPALWALREARDHLEHRLAQIAAGRFEIGPWTDDDGDVLALRIHVGPLPSGAPASTESDPPEERGWPYDLNGP